MMFVGAPYKSTVSGRTFLMAKVKDEMKVSPAELWYSVPDPFGDFLCEESSDAFAVALLLLAMRSGQDIQFEAPLSEKLFYNLNNTVQPIFRKTIGCKRLVRIVAPTRSDFKFSAKGVGCSCSMGVDSLSAFYSQQDESVPNSYHVTHLALFNCGQLGDYDAVGVAKNFENSIKGSLEFARAVDLPFVSVDSNINSFYENSGVTFHQSYIVRTCSCAMALQKGFRRYVYASSYSVGEVCFSTYDASHQEATFVPLLATENFEVILGDPMKSRVEKTAAIVQNPLTQRFLRVCWAEETANHEWHNKKYLDGKTKTNCGWCGKCLRTLLTIEVLGYDLQKYAGLFELKRYFANRESFICAVVRDRHHDVFAREIFEAMVEKNFSLSLAARRILLCQKMKIRIETLFNIPKRVLRKFSGRRG